MRFKKADIFLIGGLLAAALILWIAGRFFAAPADSLTVSVSVDGQTAEVYPLSDDREITIQTPGGTNRLIIRDGAASVTEADCPDRLCVLQPAISRPGQTIICLPHRLVITVEGALPSGPDAVAK